MVTDVYLQLKVEELEARCRRLERMLSVIEEIDNRMRGEYTLDALLERILDLCEQLIGAEAGSILFYDESLNLLRFRVARGGAPLEQLRQVTLRLGEGIAGVVAETGKPLFVADVQKDEHWSRKVDLTTGFKTRSLMAVPLRSHGRLLGVLEVLNKPDDRMYTTDDLLVLNILCERAATAIYNTTLRHEKDLERRKTEESARLAAIGQKTADISHYVKGILMVLRAGGDIVERGLAARDLDMIETGWAGLRRDLDRLQTLISSMLVFSQERIPSLERCLLNDVVRESVRSMERLARERRVAIQQNLCEHLPLMRLDREGMTEALLNLVLNAIQAMPEGGTITITTEPGAGALQRLIVRDTGPGLNLEEIRCRAVAREIITTAQATALSEAELADLIFHPNISTKGHSGTGLGLAIARKIVQEHHGSIKVDISSKGGTQFVIELPTDAVGVSTSP